MQANRLLDVTRKQFCSFSMSQGIVHSYYIYVTSQYRYWSYCIGYYIQTFNQPHHLNVGRWEHKLLCKNVGSINKKINGAPLLNNTFSKFNNVSINSIQETIYYIQFSRLNNLLTTIDLID